MVLSNIFGIVIIHWEWRWCHHWHDCWLITPIHYEFLATLNLGEIRVKYINLDNLDRGTSLGQDQPVLKSEHTTTGWLTGDGSKRLPRKLTTNGTIDFVHLWVLVLPGSCGNSLLVKFYCCRNAKHTILRRFLGHWRHSHDSWFCPCPQFPYHTAITTKQLTKVVWIHLHTIWVCLEMEHSLIPWFISLFHIEIVMTGGIPHRQTQSLIWSFS